VNAAKIIIDEHLRNSPKICELASFTGDSAEKLQNDFQTAFGAAIRGHVQNTRIRMARQKIENTAEPICSIADNVGCNNPGRFSELFKQAFDVTPSECRRTKCRLCRSRMWEGKEHG
jgi:AraC-like DNA-binding protein